MNSTDQWTTERNEIIAKVSCPYCKARIGEACIVRGKPALIAIHKPRMAAAAR